MDPEYHKPFQTMARVGQRLHFLEMARGERKPLRPFMFYSSWIEEDNFVKMVKEHWLPFD